MCVCHFFLMQLHTFHFTRLYVWIYDLCCYHGSCDKYLPCIIVDCVNLFVWILNVSEWKITNFIIILNCNFVCVWERWRALCWLVDAELNRQGRCFRVFFLLCILISWWWVMGGIHVQQILWDTFTIMMRNLVTSMCKRRPQSVGKTILNWDSLLTGLYRKAQPLLVISSFKWLTVRGGCWLYRIS